MVIAKRRLLRLDGTPFTVPDEPDHVDTSCYWFLEGSFHLVHFWVTQAVEVAPLCDRVYYAAIKSRNLALCEARKITVNYTYPYEGLYLSLGETPPPGAKKVINTRPIYEWLRDLDPRKRRLVAERCGVDLVPQAVRALAAADGAHALVKRNDPCPCGSGKKYKDCHGVL